MERQAPSRGGEPGGGQKARQLVAGVALPDLDGPGEAPVGIEGSDVVEPAGIVQGEAPGPVERGQIGECRMAGGDGAAEATEGGAGKGGGEGGRVELRLGREKRLNAPRGRRMAVRGRGGAPSPAPPV